MVMMFHFGQDETFGLHWGAILAFQNLNVKQKKLRDLGTHMYT
jgi:hypothetical protein